MMTVYNNNYDNENEVKGMEKKGIEATNDTTSNIVGGDSPTVNNDVEGGSGPEDLFEAEARGNCCHSQDQDTSSHGRNGWMTIVLILLGFLAVAVATTMDFEWFNKFNSLSSNDAKNGAIVTSSLQVQAPPRETSLMSRSLKKKKVLKCGDDVVNRKVSLKKDLVCKASDVVEIDGVPNAALTLDGPGAVLKCKGKSNKVKIFQIQSEGENDASACEALDGYDGNLEIDSDKVEAIKGNEDEGCGLPFLYLYGIKLLNGAKAVGCDIENFLVGAYVGQGAEELSDVTVSNNRYGVVIETNKTVMIDNVNAEENGQLGILASNDGTSVFVKEYTPGGSIELKEITATASGNGGKGIAIEGGSDISVNSAVVTGNVAAGILIENVDKIGLKNVKAEGNDRGIAIDNSHEIDLKEIDANANGDEGIFIKGSQNIELKEITASGNGGNGIEIQEGSDISVINTVVTGNGASGISIAHSKNIDLLKNIKANNNTGAGIGMIGPVKMKINLESIEANNNGFVGIAMYTGLDVEMCWKGRISLDGNNDGLKLDRTGGTITITISGELTADNNENIGIYLGDDRHVSNVTVSIAEGASLSACGNGNYDIVTFGEKTSVLTVVMAGGGTGTCFVGWTQGVNLTLPSECGRTCPDPARFF
eukprot:scaffold862_cov76-Skeletonema_dohrnii-CCMP3373.AAC.2